MQRTAGESVASIEHFILKKQTNKKTLITLIDLIYELEKKTHLIQTECKKKKMYLLM